MNCVRSVLDAVGIDPARHAKSAAGINGAAGPAGHLKYVAFGTTMLASAALHNIFATYYLDFFLSVVRVNHVAFYAAQLVFMVWNAANDVVFGWLSDRLAPRRPDGRRDRLPIIRFGGALWCVAFCMVWLPWGDATDVSLSSGGGAMPAAAPLPSPWLAAAHFAFVLCFYDAMLTLVEVNHSALLADLTFDSNERAKYNMYSAFCAALGASARIASCAA